MAEAKTKPTATSVDDFIDAVDNPGRRNDARTLRALMQRLSGEPATMWGPSIVGFGSYTYRYDSGRTGSMCRIGFSPRKAELVLYLIDGFEGRSDVLSRLGKYRIGKSCLYLKSLDGIDMTAVETLIMDSLAAMDQRYPR
jgi:hypothetical protein